MTKWPFQRSLTQGTVGFDKHRESSPSHQAFHQVVKARVERTLSLCWFCNQAREKKHKQVFKERKIVKCAIFTAGLSTSCIREEFQSVGGGIPAGQKMSASGCLWVLLPLSSQQIFRAPAGIQKGQKSDLGSGNLVWLKCMLSLSIRLQLGATVKGICCVARTHHLAESRQFSATQDSSSAVITDAYSGRCLASGAIGTQFKKTIPSSPFICVCMYFQQRATKRFNSMFKLSNLLTSKDLY